ncbi:MAG: c-type cytochrome [Alphaproteobacteria bacterium]|nr:c-type cytochrome [Alphaproteobacteria bacterium]MBF0129252.1 c-type cytochrome [Alphaproteobacteria bacterium]
MAEPTPAMLANACAGCHGTNGLSVGPTSPIISGMASEYFVAAMAAYKKGEWPSTIMGRIAKGYSDEQIKAMGDFFAKQPFVRAAQKNDAAKAKTGAKLHEEYCEKCHEKGGSAGEDAGVLAGQWMPYLEHAMEDYTSGKRPMTKKMQKQVDQLVQDHKHAGVEALVNFYGSAK